MPLVLKFLRFLTCASNSANATLHHSATTGRRSYFCPWSTFTKLYFALNWMREAFAF